MGQGTGKSILTDRGVNRNVQRMYDGASPGEKRQIALIVKNGVRTPAAIRRQMNQMNDRNAPRREQRARSNARRAQLDFDNRLVNANSRQRAGIRRDAADGIDTRVGAAGLRAARQNIAAANERAAARRARAEAAAAAAAAAAAPRRRGRRRAQGGMTPVR